MPLFRRGFTVGKPVRHAVISISALGHYHLSINGRETTASLLNPGWTDYRKTVLYNRHDVTELLQPGQTPVGVILGNGLSNVAGVEERSMKFVDTFGHLLSIGQPPLNTEDGRRQPG